MNQPARRTDADATSANQSNVTHIFCGKPDVVHPATLPPAPKSTESRRRARFFLPIHSQAARRHGGVAEGCNSASAAPESRFRQAELRNYLQKRKTRPGGQPDGSSHMGALGVDGRSRRIQPRWGGITAPTVIVSRQDRSTFKPTSEFFYLFGRGFWTENYRPAGDPASPTADLSDAMAAGGWFRARVAGASCRSGTISPAGRSETVATGVAGAGAIAETAA